MTKTIEESLQNFTFEFPIQIRWVDLDPLGHVNNAVFVSYFEIARGVYMMKACPNWDWMKDMFLIANINVNYYKEILLTSPDIKAHIRTTKIGSKSFELEYLISSLKDNKRQIHATGSSTQVMFDMKSKTTMQVPDWVRISLTNYDSL